MEWETSGRNATLLKDRYFKVKDRVENYLADEVRAGRMPLSSAQHGIRSPCRQVRLRERCGAIVTRADDANQSGAGDSFIRHADLFAQVDCASKMRPVAFLDPAAFSRTYPI
jgi:hypothetical protein